MDWCDLSVVSPVLTTLVNCVAGMKIYEYFLNLPRQMTNSIRESGFIRRCIPRDSRKFGFEFSFLLKKPKMSSYLWECVAP